MHPAIAAKRQPTTMAAEWASKMSMFLSIWINRVKYQLHFYGKMMDG